jgi:hypothetical protein
MNGSKISEDKAFKTPKFKEDAKSLQDEKLAVYDYLFFWVLERYIYILVVRRQRFGETHCCHLQG